MSARREIVFSLLLAAALTGGSSFGCATPAEEVRSQLRDWQDLAIQDYVFVHGGGPSYGVARYDIIDGAYRVEVHGGVPQPIATAFFDGLPARAETPLTIDALMERFADTLDYHKDPAELRIEYDRTYHFITEGFVDGDLGAADDEYSLYISCFSTQLDACPVTTITTAACEAMLGTVTPVRMEQPSMTCQSIYSEVKGQIEGQPTMVCCIDPPLEPPVTE